uniref:Uncharacterized protein n=1 Tax=Magallana gigas TaxID=29159 RepID=K1QPT6_MAGGI
MALEEVEIGAIDLEEKSSPKLSSSPESPDKPDPTLAEEKERSLPKFLEPLKVLPRSKYLGYVEECPCFW